MATRTAFYIQHTDNSKVIEKLKTLSGVSTQQTGTFPNEFYNSYLFDEKAKPDYLVIGQTQPDWISVFHNSFNKLQQWGKELSAQFNTTVIITAAQNTSDAYYFAVYKQGVKNREINICYSDDSNPVNFGEPFEFETGKISKEESNSFVFDFDELEKYCRQLGLEIEPDYEAISWTTIKSDKPRKSVQEFLMDAYHKSQKPWWKFW